MRRKLSTILLLGSSALLPLSLMAPHIKPVHPINANFVGLAFPFILLLSFLLLLFLYKNVWPLISLVTFALCIIGLLQMRLYIQVNTAQNGAGQLSVMSYNAMMGNRMVNNRHVLTKENTQQLSQHLNGEEPIDIFCGQEVNIVVDEAIQAENLFSYQHKVKDIAAVIYSRYPIIDKGTVDLSTKVNGCLWADIALPKDTVRIYSVHLQSNRLTMESYHLLTDDHEYEREKALRGAKDILTKYHKYAVIRANQANTIARSISKSPYPVIVCGDFNDPPMSYTYRQLKGTLKDNFLVAGSGIGSTWNGSVPLLRIDYILSDPALSCTSYKTIYSNLSDHYPIKASFEFK